MADERFVYFKALADFSAVRKEAAKTEASLASLKAQTDSTSVSNDNLGSSEKAAARDVGKAQNDVKAAVTSTAQARDKATQSVQRSNAASSSEISSMARVEQAFNRSKTAQLDDVAASKAVLASRAKLNQANQVAEDRAKKLTKAEVDHDKVLSNSKSTEAQVLASEKRLSTARDQAQRSLFAQENAILSLERAQQRQIRTQNAAAVAQAGIAQASKKAADDAQKASDRAVANADRESKAKERQLATEQKLADKESAQAQKDLDNAAKRAANIDKEQAKNAKLRDTLAALIAARESSASAAKIEENAEDNNSSALGRSLAAYQRQKVVREESGRLSDKERAAIDKVAGAQASLTRARQAESVATGTVNNNLKAVEEAHALEAAATYRAGDAEARYSELKTQGTVSTEELLTAERDATKARIDAEKATAVARKSVDDLEQSERRLTVAHGGVSAASTKLGRDIRVAENEFKSAGGGGNFLTGILKGLTAAFDDGGAGANLMGAALSSVKFASIGIGLLTLVQSISALISSLFALVSAIGPALGSLAAIGPIAIAAGTALGTIKLAFSGIGNALKAYTADQKAQATTSTKTANTEVSNAEAIANAQQSLADAREQVGVTAQSVSDNIAKAFKTEKDAQDAVTQSQKDLSQARIDAKKNIDDLRQAVVDAALAERGATLGLEDAKASLTKTLNDPTSTRLQREQAQLAVDNAANQATAAKKGSKDSQTAYQTAAKKGIESSDLVVSAKKSEADAIDKLKESQHSYNVTVSDGARQNAKALEAVRKAIQALGDAQRSAATPAAAASTAANNYAYALSKLTPAGRAFVKQLISMKSYWTQLKATAANGLLPGLTADLKRLPVLFPVINNAVAKMAGGLSDLAHTATDLFVSPKWIASLKQLGDAGPKIIGPFGKAFLLLLDVFRAVSVAAIPLAITIGKATKAVAAHLDKIATAPGAYKKMQAYFVRSWNVVKLLGNILKNLAGGLFNMGKVAGVSGHRMLVSIDNAAKRFDAWAKSVAGHRELADFFDKVERNTRAVIRILGDLTKAFFRAGSSGSLKPIMDAIHNTLEPAIQRLFATFKGKNLGVTLINALAKVIDILTEVSKNSNSIGLFVGIVGGFISTLAWFVKTPGVAPAIGAIGGALAALAAIRLIGVITGVGRLSGALTKFLALRRDALAASAAGTVLTVPQRVATFGRVGSVAAADGTAAAGAVGAAGAVVGGPVSRARSAVAALAPAPIAARAAQRRTLAENGSLIPIGGGVARPPDFSGDTRIRNVTEAESQAHRINSGVMGPETPEEAAHRINSETHASEPRMHGPVVAPTRASKAKGVLGKIPIIGKLFGRGGAAAGAAAGGAEGGAAAAAGGEGGVAALANPIGLAVAALAALAIALVVMYKKWKTFRDGVNNVIKDIGKAFSWLWTQVIKPDFEQIMEFLSKNSGGFKKLFNAIGDAFSQLGTSISKHGKGIKQTFSIVGDVFKVIGKIIVVAIEAIILILNAVASVLAVVITKFIVPLVKIMSAIFVLAAVTIKNTLMLIYTVITTIWNSIYLFFKTALMVLATIFVVGWKVIYDIVTGKWSQIGTDLRNGWNKIWGYLTGAWKSAEGIASKAWNGIANAIIGEFEGVGSALAKIWKTVETSMAGSINYITQKILNPFIGAVNDVLKFLHVSIKIPTIGAISTGGSSSQPSTGTGNTGATHATGGGIKSFAKGGVLSGYTPGRDVHKFYSPTAGELHLSGGEGILVPEAVRALGGKQGIQNINSSLSNGRVSGGSNASGRHFSLGGVVGSALKGVGGAALGGLRDIAAWGTKESLEALLSPIKALAGAIPSEIMRNLATGSLDAVVNGAYNLIKGKQAEQAVVSSTPSSGPQNSVGLNSNQMSNAAAIAKVGLAMGGTPRDVEIAFMTGLVESNIRNLANPNVPESMSLPHDGTGSDHDSVGIFQQRNSWGSAAQRLNPSETSKLFFNRELSVPGRANMGMGNVAQKVQVSAFPDRYAAFQSQAANIYSELLATGTGNTGATHATGGGVQSFHAGGIVKGIGPGGHTNSIASLKMQAQTEAPHNASWTNALSAQAKRRLSGVSNSQDVVNNTYPRTIANMAPGDAHISKFIAWQNKFGAKSYDEMYMQNNVDRHPYFPLQAYISNPAAFKNHKWPSRNGRKDTTVSVLQSELSKNNSWAGSYRNAMGVAGGSKPWTTDMDAPSDHILAHALGKAHPADWPHPWSGPVTAVEEELAQQDRSNALNKEFYGDLQILSNWGFTDLVSELLDKGVADGLEIARSASKDKGTAKQLNDSIKAGKAGFGGLASDDQALILKATSIIASGTPTKNKGLRDVSGTLQVPDYAIVNLYDAMSAQIGALPKNLTGKFNNDVSMFRQGLFYANTGAIVPGHGNSDTVPAMLTPGEGVLRKSVMRMLGHDGFNQLNNGQLPQMLSTGGIVLSPDVQISPRLGQGAMGSPNIPNAKPTAPAGETTYITNIDTTIQNASTDSVYEMNKMLQRKAVTGEFNRAGKVNS